MLCGHNLFRNVMVVCVPNKAKSEVTTRWLQPHGFHGKGSWLWGLHFDLVSSISLELRWKDVCLEHIRHHSGTGLYTVWSSSHFFTMLARSDEWCWSFTMPSTTHLSFSLLIHFSVSLRVEVESSGLLWHNFGLSGWVPHVGQVQSWPLSLAFSGCQVMFWFLELLGFSWV